MVEMPAKSASKKKPLKKKSKKRSATSRETYGILINEK